MRDHTTDLRIKNGLKNSTSLTLLSLGVLIISFSGAQAQSSSDDQVTTADGQPARDEIVVTGRRRDAELSIEAKRNAKQVIDVLSADQASRLPDNNIAESLARIPGVTVSRSGDSGNGNFIAIRGLDSALNNVQFNGVNSGQANGGNRRVPLDGIASDDIAEIRVAKSLLPQDEGEGIGGAANIIALTPLGRGRDRLTFTAAGRYGEFADKMGYDVRGAFTKVFGDTFGVNLSVSKRRRFINNFEIDATSSNVAFVDNITTADGQVLTGAEFLELDARPRTGRGLGDAGDAFDNVPAGFIPIESIVFEEQGYKFNDQIRDTLTITGAVDWRPHPSTLFTLGGRMSRRDTQATEAAIRFDTDDREFVAVGDRVETIFNDAEIRYEVRLEDELDLNANVFLRGTTELERLKVVYQASYARAVEDDPQTDFDFDSDSVIDTDAPIQPFGFVNTYFPVPNLAVLDNTSFTDAVADIPGSVNFDGFETELESRNVNDRYAARIDAEYDLGWELLGGVFNSVSVGGQFERSDLRVDRITLVDDRDRVNLDGTYDADGGDAGNRTLEEFSDLFSGLTSLSPIGSPLDAIGITGIPAVNREAVLSFVGTFHDSFLSQGFTPEVEPFFFDAREEEFSGYFQTEFEIGKLTLVGGVRVEHYEGRFATPLEFETDLIISNGVDEDATGNTIDLATTDQLEVVNSSTSNTEVLPRFNALYQVNDQFQIRAGFGYSIARPTFSQLGGATDISIDLRSDNNEPGATPVLPGVATAAEVVAAGGISLDELTELGIRVRSGNPDLDNARSMNADLSFEYYPARGTAITLGVFYKRIQNFIFIGAESGLGAINTDLIESLLSADGQTLVSGLGGVEGLIDSGITGDISVRTPRNGDTARLVGAEFGISHQLTWAPGFLSDMGFFGNIAYTDSEATYAVVGAADPVLNVDEDGEFTEGLEADEALVALGFSEVGDGLFRTASFFNSPNLNANASLFYEANGLEIALSAQYQGRAFDATDNFGLDQYNGRFYQMDIYVGYDLPIPENYGKYEIFAEVQDVTDNGLKPTDLQTVGRTRTLFDEASFNGREVRFGVRGRF